MSSIDLIFADPEVANAEQVCVRSTNVTVSAILDAMAAGESEQRILRRLGRRGLSLEGLRAAVAYAAGLARKQELSPPASAALAEYSQLRFEGMTPQQVPVWASAILANLAAGKSEEEMIETVDPTVSRELIRAAAAYGAALTRDEWLPPAVPEGREDRSLRDLLGPDDQRLVDDFYVYRNVRERWTLHKYTLEGEFAAWRQLVEQVEGGHVDDHDEYMAVGLTRRDALEDAVSLLSPSGQDPVLAMTRSWDRRFDAATQVLEWPVGGPQVVWRPRRWWWYRLPRRFGPRMREALRARGVH